MQEDKSQLINYAMRCGLYLGAFWVVKYLFLIGSFQFPALASLEVILRLGTPILLFYFLIKYRTATQGAPLGYWHGIQFSIMLFFFASLLEAVAIFVHTTWINPSYISDIYGGMATMAKDLGVNETIFQAIESQPTPSPINYTFSSMMADVFSGLILSLIIVPISNRFNTGRKQDV